MNQTARPTESNPTGPRPFDRSWPAMATRFDLRLIGPDPQHLEAVAVAIEEEVHRLEKLLSCHDPTSEVTRINRGAAAAPIKVDADVWELLTACEKFRRATDGFFDVTAASTADKEPGDMITTGPRLLLEADQQTVRFFSTEVAIDLGGVGKGFVLDRAGDILKRFDIRSALLSAGTSSVLAVGRPAEGQAWPVDIRNPAHETFPPVGRVELADRSLSCSAAMRPGQYTSDVVNPHTQQPLVGSDAVVVLAPTGVAAEALSTALLAMGPARAAEYLGRSEWTKVERIEAAWIDASAASPTLNWFGGSND